MVVNLEKEKEAVNYEKKEEDWKEKVLETRESKYIKMDGEGSKIKDGMKVVGVDVRNQHKN